MSNKVGAYPSGYDVVFEDPDLYTITHLDKVIGEVGRNTGMMRWGYKITTGHKAPHIYHTYRSAAESLIHVHKLVLQSQTLTEECTIPEGLPDGISFRDNRTKTRVYLGDTKVGTVREVEGWYKVKHRVSGTRLHDRHNTLEGAARALLAFDTAFNSGRGVR